MAYKRALLIGINYRGTSSELSGCIEDVANVKKYLLKHGYSEEKIVVLTEDTTIKPTRTNILKEILSLIVSGDKTLFFHYSGHGGSIWDTSGDEKDGFDECIYPLDSIKDSNKIILDDEWRNLLKYLQKDQSLFALMDCCHSGTGMDLAYGLYQRFGLSKLKMVRETTQKTKGKVVMMSGCLDSQTSSDAFIDEKFQGALTYSFLKTLRHKSNISYTDLVLGVRKILKRRGFAQIPTLSSGRKLNLKNQVLFT